MKNILPLVFLSFETKFVTSPFAIDSDYTKTAYLDIFISKNLLQIDQKSCYNLMFLLEYNAHIVKKL